MSVQQDAKESIQAFFDWFSGLKFRYQVLVASMVFSVIFSWVPGVNVIGISVVTASILLIIITEVWERLRDRV